MTQCVIKYGNQNAPWPPLSQRGGMAAVGFGIAYSKVTHTISLYKECWPAAAIFNSSSICALATRWTQMPVVHAGCWRARVVQCIRGRVYAAALCPLRRRGREWRSPPVGANTPTLWCRENVPAVPRCAYRVYSIRTPIIFFVARSRLVAGRRSCSDRGRPRLSLRGVARRARSRCESG